MALTPDERPPSARFVRWLAARTTWVLFGIFLAWFVVWTVIAFVGLDAFVGSARQLGLSTVAGSMMGAVGALFAFLTGFVIATEWNQHRDAEQTVGMEADACVRLAWASAAPHCDGTSIRAELVAYLHSVLDDDWPKLGEGAGGSRETHEQLTRIQSLVRRIASDPEVPPTVAGDLTSAADRISVNRADRCNVAAHDLPTPLLLLAFVAGVVLVLTTVALALRLERGDGLMIGGVVVVIALDLALLVGISAPFTGGLCVHPTPLVRVLHDLEEGQYGPVV